MAEYRSTVARKGPSVSRSPARSPAEAGRSSVRVRKSPAPKTTAVKWRMPSAASECCPARRTSMGLPLRDMLSGEACRQCSSIVRDHQIAAAQQDRRILIAASAGCVRGRRRPAVSPDVGAGLVSGPLSLNCLLKSPLGSHERKQLADCVGKFACRGLRLLEFGRIGVGNSNRVQRRIHIARVERQDLEYPLLVNSSFQMRLR